MTKYIMDFVMKNLTYNEVKGKSVYKVRGVK